MTDGVVVSDEGHVRTVRMSRPKVKNALSSELAWGVVGAVEEAARDDSVWVVCLTGTGDAFCSGVNLRGSGDYHPHSPLTAQLDDLGWVSRFLLTLRRDCEKPVVCGVNGVAAGAGLALAMAADMRLLKRGARLVPGYPGIGASPDGGLTFTLAQAIGYERAFRFLMDPRAWIRTKRCGWAWRARWWRRPIGMRGCRSSAGGCARPSRPSPCG